ncbi:MAG: hypothetical protein MUO27_09945 [Sedimentisphaerales bacterium]|nr:hypothetical protein [Sedimentisphaerales bacterium]
MPTEANYRPLPRSHPDDIAVRVEQQQGRFGITDDLSIRCGSLVNPKTGAGLAVLVAQAKPRPVLIHVQTGAELAVRVPQVGLYTNARDGRSRGNCAAVPAAAKPAKRTAGQAPPYNWIPVCAGMTLRRTSCYGGQATPGRAPM